MSASTHVLFACTLLIAPSLAHGAGFLHGTNRSRVAVHGASISELHAAMSEVFGCGEQSNSNRLPVIRSSIEPIWRAIPKNQKGLVQWRLLRYVAHRYFMKQSSLMVRGFEPSKMVNESNLGSAHVLDSKVPSIAEKLMTGREAIEGFSIDDAAAMIAVLEQLIFDSESSLLESLYQQMGASISDGMSHRDLSKLMEEYLIHWMFASDPDTFKEISQNRALLPEAVNHWDETQNLVAGMVKSMEFSQQRNPSMGYGNAAMAQSYSIDDAHQVAGQLTRSFASYWETECQAIKGALVDMDTSGTGRVWLKDFYSSNKDGVWHFGESESYLRDLGALDESSWRGPQVIIPNYMQAASNCIISNANYNVCCMNECESILGDIEVAIGAPVATVDQILQLVANMTNFDDQPVRVDTGLSLQLQSIGEVHGNTVPLHGRLFAQWLHYTFPRECAFPHRSGTVVALTPVERGDDSLASQDEVEKHASKKMISDGAVNAELDAMSQWSEDEELMVDYSIHMHTPWGRKKPLISGVVVLIVALLVALALKLPGHKTAAGITGPDHNSKLHFV